MRRPLWLAVAIAVSCAHPLWAQLGELQAGVIGSYGTSNPYRQGAGLVLGVAPGRLVYVGLRWVYYGGASTSPGSPPVEVRNRAQIFATDLGVQIPVKGGLLEVLPIMSLGMVQFAQRGRPASGEVSGYSKEFFAAPGLAMQVSAGSFAIIPEVQYYLTGHTELAWPVRRRGPAVSVRLVLLSEIRRIRR